MGEWAYWWDKAAPEQDSIWSRLHATPCREFTSDQLGSIARELPGIVDLVLASKKSKPARGSGGTGLKLAIG